MYCINCGFKHVPAANFCQNCGTKVANVPANSPANPPQSEFQNAPTLNPMTTMLMMGALGGNSGGVLGGAELGGMDLGGAEFL